MPERIVQCTTFSPSAERIGLVRWLAKLSDMAIVSCARGKSDPPSTSPTMLFALESSRDPISNKALPLSVSARASAGTAEREAGAILASASEASIRAPWFVGCDTTACQTQFHPSGFVGS